MNLAIPTPGIRRRSVTGLWLRHAVSFVRYWKFIITWVLVEPVIILVAVGFGVGKLVHEVEGAPSYAEFMAPGLIMGNAMFHALFETSWNAYNRLDNDVYETALTTPITITEITMGDILWAVTRSVMTVVGTATVAAMFCWINHWEAIGILIPAIMVGTTFGALGFLFSAVAPHTTFLTLVFTLVASPMFFSPVRSSRFRSFPTGSSLSLGRCRLHLQSTSLVDLPLDILRGHISGQRYTWSH
ncbi:MAG: ABC transporter permease [Chloroflexi bacterium]|nr:ABC transporter permease [Chloroflexota bacterium]